MLPRCFAAGLAPEEFHVNLSNASEVISSYLHNLLRPEAVESLFYMWRATKDVKYRRMGWSIFQAFALHSRTAEGAFAKVHVGPCSKQPCIASSCSIILDCLKRFLPSLCPALAHA